MSDRSEAIIFRLSMALLTIIVLMFVGNALFKTDLFVSRFESLGYPSYLIYPLVAAKLLGLIAIWSGRSTMLKEWAYAGFFFNFVLAFFAELQADDGELFSTIIALASLMVSYYVGRLRGKYVRTASSVIAKV